MRILHAGCGGTSLPPWYEGRGTEVRLDIDPATKPDIVASLTDLGEIGQFDVIYTSHCVEHLYPADVGTALAEFYRVTKPGGHAMVIVPDLEGVQATDEVLYELQDIGPLTGLDLIYGCRYDKARSSYMAHHSGFVSATLEAAMLAAGFETVTMKRLPQYNLMAVGQRAK
jgi:ubiquinone/menaquinone biosynthesis C-methylase UbiE